MRRVVAGSLVFALLLSAPLAHASAASGDFAAQGTVSFPLGSTSVSAPRAIYNPDGLSLAALSLESGGASITSYVRTFLLAEANGVVIAELVEPHRGATETARFDRLTLAGTGASEGFLGVHPKSGARASLTNDTGSRVVARNVSQLGNESPQLAEEESFHYYSQLVTGPHLLIEGAGDLAFIGSGSVQLMGPTIVARSGDESAVYRTGVERDGGTPERVTYRWVVIEFTDGRLDASSTAPFQIAADDAAASWAGDAVLETATGNLRDQDGTHHAYEQTVFLAGTFEAVLHPVERGGTMETILQLEGDLTATNLETRVTSSRTAPAPSLAWTWYGPLLLLAGVLVGGLLTGTVLRRRRRAPPPIPASAPVPASSTPYPLTAEDCILAAEQLMLEGRWVDATAWTGRALRLVPTSLTAMDSHALALANAGLMDEALELYDQLHWRAPEVARCVFVAELAENGGRPFEETERWLRRAIELDPQAFLDEAVPTFPHWASDARFAGLVETAVQDARRRALGGDDDAVQAPR